MSLKLSIYSHLDNLPLSVHQQKNLQLSNSHPTPSLPGSVSLLRIQEIQGTFSETIGKTKATLSHFAWAHETPCESERPFRLTYFSVLLTKFTAPPMPQMILSYILQNIPCCKHILSLREYQLPQSSQLAHCLPPTSPDQPPRKYGLLLERGHA